MNKILLVAQGGFERGGIQSVLINIVRTLHTRYRFDIVLFTNTHGGYEEEFLRYGGNVFTIPISEYGIKKQISGYTRFITDYKRIKKIIKENGPYQCIHTNSGIDSWTALKAANECGIKCRIAHSHVVYNNLESAFTRKLIDKLSAHKIKRYATHLLGCSQLACDSMYGKNTQSIVLPNPYDDLKFDSGKYDQNLDTDSPVLIQVGSYSNIKNQIYSLKILLHLIKVYPYAKIHFVGFDNDNYESQMKDFIINNKIEANVEMHSADSNIPELLSKSHYFLLPSRTESFAIVLVEAQAMGLKCFVSDVVPTVSNAGGCIYLSIRDSEILWADTIISDFVRTKGTHAKYDCSKFTNAEYASKINQIYSANEK